VDAADARFEFVEIQSPVMLRFVCGLVVVSDVKKNLRISSLRINAVQVKSIGLI
jgi:hypothetical protein